MSLFDVALAAAMAALLGSMVVRHGPLAPSSLAYAHLLIGVAIKGLYEKYIATDDATLLAPWVLVPDQLPLTELQLLGVLTGVLLLSVPRPPPAWGGHRDAVRLDAALRAVGLLHIVFMAMALALIASSLGGLAQAARTLSSRVSESVSGLAWVFVFGDVAVVSSLFVYALGRAVPLPSTRSQAFKYLAPLSAVLYLAFLGGRGNLLQYVISLMIIRQMTSPPGERSNWMLLGFMCAAPVVLLTGLVTRTMNQYGQTFGEALLQLPGTLVEMTLAPFALIDHYALSQVYAQERGHDFGSDWLLLPLKFIPRSLWAGKDVPLAIGMREHFWGDSLGGIPPGLFGEGAIAFGLLGGLFSAFILVVAVRSLVRLVCAPLPSIAHVALYAVLVPYVAFNLVRGGLDVAFVRIVIQLSIGAALVYGIHRSLQPAAATHHAAA